MIWFFWRRYLRNDEKRNISPLSGFMFLFEVFSEILDYDFAVTLEELGPIEFVQSLPGILVNSGSNCVTTTWKRWMAKCDCKLFNLILWSQWFNTFKCNRSMFDLKQELGSNQGKTYMPRDSDSFLLDRSMNFKLWLKLEEKYSVNLLEIERSIDILVHTSNMCS